jgi:hypothetical protein
VDAIALLNRNQEIVMNRSFGIIVAASIAVTAPWLVAPVAAAPISSLTSLQNTMTPSVETVQYRRGGNRGRRIGGIGLGLGAGAVIGGILGATEPYGYYGYGPGYTYAPGYGYGPGYAYAPGYGYGYGNRPGYPYGFDRQLCCRN